MTREVAAVYMNATRAFGTCQSRKLNGPSCGGGLGKLGGGGGGLKAKAKLPGGKHGLLNSKRALLAASQHTPYWATPQCVLKRHLLSHLPDVRMVDCLREAGQRGPVMRLVRPS